MMHAPGVEITDGAIYLLAAVMQQFDERLQFDAMDQSDFDATQHSDADPPDVQTSHFIELVDDAFADGLSPIAADPIGALIAGNIVSNENNENAQVPEATGYVDQMTNSFAAPMQFNHTIQAVSPTQVEVGIFTNASYGSSYALEDELFI